MGQLPGPSSGAEQFDAYLWILLRVLGPPPRCIKEASGAQAHGSQTGWNQKADGWDFWTTLLPHQQPIRRKSYILKLYPKLPLKTLPSKPLGNLGFLSTKMFVPLAWPLRLTFLCSRIRCFGLLIFPVGHTNLGSTTFSVTTVSNLSSAPFSLSSPPGDTAHLRLAFQPMYQYLNPARIQIGNGIHNLLTEIALLIRRRQWHPTPVLLPGKSHGWRSLVGCSPWGR